MSKSDPQGATDMICCVFDRMDMDDWENVTFIGSGHTFGKTMVPVLANSGLKNLIGHSGAPISFSPGEARKTNTGLDKTLAMLEPIN